MSGDSPTEERARSNALASQALRLPRIARIVIVSVFAVGVTILVFPLVDRIYIENFFNADTVSVPALVSAGIGLVVYIIGWLLLIGTAGDRPPARQALAVYILAGVAVLASVITLLIIGAVIGSQQ